MFDVRFVIDDWIGLIKTNTQSWSTTTPINQSMNQSINQSALVRDSQSINQSINE